MPIMVNSLAILPQVVVGSITVGVIFFWSNCFMVMCLN